MGNHLQWTRGLLRAHPWLPIALALAAAVALGLLFAAGLVYAAGPASDDAGQTAYDAGWQDGDDGGTGFGAGWDLETDTANGSEAGHFIGASTANGNGDTNIDGDIDASAGRAWGLYANSGKFAHADRPFAAPGLPVGSRFSLLMDNGNIDNGAQVGLALRNAANDGLLRVYFTGGETNYTVHGDAAQDSSLGWTDEGLAITLTLVTTSTYQAELTALDGAGSVTVAGSLDAGGGDQTVTRLHLFNTNAGTGSDNDLFFNLLELTPPACFAQIVGGSYFASVDASAIQLALDAAASGDTIMLAGTCSGVVTRDLTEQSGYIEKDVTLQGGFNPLDWTDHDPDVYPTTLDALSLGRVFRIQTGITVTLEDLQLQGGYAEDGGAILTAADALTIKDSVITGSYAAYNGGGLYADFGAVTLDNTQVIENEAGEAGGGLYATIGLLPTSAPADTCVPLGASLDDYWTTLNLENGTEVLSNTATTEGGGLYAFDTQVVVDDSLIQYNYAAVGGGIYNEGFGFCDLPIASGASLTAEPFLEAQLTVSGGSLIDHNEAFYKSQSDVPEFLYGNGGGVFNYGATAAIVDSTVSNNAASFGGGGLGSIEGAVIMSGTQVLSNTAYFVGGGIASSGAFLVGNSAECVVNAADLSIGGLLFVLGGQIQGNVAGGYGGGVANDNTLVLIGAATITGNAAGNGGGLYNADEYCYGFNQPAQGAEDFFLASMNLLEGTVVSDNHATWNIFSPDTSLVQDLGMGGGLFTGVSTVSVMDSTFISNSADDDGGGLASLGGLVVLSGTQVLSNTAEDGSGGGILLDYPYYENGDNSPDGCLTAAPASLYYADLLLINSRIAYNWADDAGGGVASWGPYMELEHTTVEANRAELGGGLFHEETGCFASAPNPDAAEGDYEAAILVHTGSAIVGNQADDSDDGFEGPQPSVFSYVFNGGGIYSAFSSVRVLDSLIESNTAEDDGAGLAAFESYVVLSATQVLSNTAIDGSGGGVLMSEFEINAPEAVSCVAAVDGGGFWADLVVRGGSAISHNSADNAGGGLASFGPTVLVDASQVTDNRAQLGGGLYYEDIPDCFAAKADSADTTDGGWAAVRVRNGSDISGNRANHHDEEPDLAVNSFSEEFYGGGLYSLFGSVQVSESSVYSNTAVDGGGGVFVLLSELSVHDSVIHSNTAAEGGGLLLLDSVTDITNSTVSSNHADDGDGGGILVGESDFDRSVAPDSAEDDAYLGNVTVAFNTAAYSGQNLAAYSEEFMLRNTIVAGSPDDNCYNDGDINTAGYNLEDGDTCGLVDVTDLPETEALLGPLSDNGGPTLTHALLAASLALDNGACDFDHDQRGEPRPDVDGGACDIGAYEGSGFVLYFPLFIHADPDLVGSFTLSPNKTSFAPGEAVTVTVVVTNQGNAPTVSGFWVDFSINPAHPSEVNEPWYDNCGLAPCRGIAWYVGVSLAPGQSITLTSTPGSYSAGHTMWSGSFPAGATDLYLYVDSWNPTSPTASVKELDETNNRTELHGLTVAGALVFAQPSGTANFPDRWIRPAE